MTLLHSSVAADLSCRVVRLVHMYLVCPSQVLAVHLSMILWIVYMCYMDTYV